MQKLNLTGQSKHGEGVDDTMRGLSAVIADNEQIYIDNGAIHAKSKIERGVKYVTDRNEVTNPREIWMFWVTLRRLEGGNQGYNGITAFQMWLDEEAKVAYKSLADQVNKMEKAVKGVADLTHVPAPVKERLQAFLQTTRAELWEHATDTFQSAFVD